MERTWSAEQRDIFNWFANEKNHLVVNALAGTGKTTTIIEAINYAPERRILLCAFNRRIMLELNARITNKNASAKTLHGLGYGYVMANWPGVQVDADKRGKQLTDAVCGANVEEVIKRLVTKLHTLGRETVPHARKLDDLLELAYNFECVPENGWADRYPADWVVGKALQAMDLAAKVKPAFIDYADMIFLPVRNRWLKKRFDMVVVDEAQDMTTAQLELALGSCSGRMVIVGDRNQAIYGFRGADSESMDRLTKELRAQELTLTTTYRCGKAIVAMAQRFVPEYKAHEANGDGLVERLNMVDLTDTVALGDFVISRKNAPLVSVAMRLLREGKRARIAGKDIGQGLKALLKRISKNATDIEQMLYRLEVWEQRETQKALAAQRETRAQLVSDQAETIRALSEDVDTIREIEQRIDGLFTDDGLGEAGVVTCSSVHKAKGLESNNVFLLEETFFSTAKQEEANIRYVAITRAKNKLFLVDEKFPKKVKVS